MDPGDLTVAGTLLVDCRDVVPNDVDDPFPADLRAFQPALRHELRGTPSNSSIKTLNGIYVILEYISFVLDG